MVSAKVRAPVFVALAAIALQPSVAPAQSSTGSSFSFTIRHERERGTTTRTGEGIVAGEKARLRFATLGSSDERMPSLGPNATVFVTGAGDPVEALVIANDSARTRVRPARRLAEMRAMIARMPQAPRVSATLVSLRADTTEPESRFAGLPTTRYRASGEVLIVYSAAPDAGAESIPDTVRLTLEADALHSWAAPGKVDPFRGLQTLDLLLSAQGGGNPVIAAETSRILAALPRGLPLRSAWTVSVSRNGRTTVERGIVELSRVGNAAVPDADVAVPSYAEAPAGTSQ